MLREPDNFLKTGECMDVHDDRCICGIDGVPSCSADIIDRNMFCSTKIELDASSPNKTVLIKTGTIYYEHPSNKRHIRHGCRGISRTRKSIRSPEPPSVEDPELHRQKREQSEDDNKAETGQFQSFKILLNAEGRQRHTHGRKSSLHHTKKELSEEDTSNKFPAPLHNSYQDDGSNVQLPPSLLIASGNRCR